MAVAVAAVAVEINMFCNNQTRLLLQFHITGMCNLRCKHCYRTEGDVEDLSYTDVINVVDQFLELRRKYNLQHKIKKRGHINLTGGEPFFRKDIKEIIKYIGEHRSEISYGILSNGSFINQEIIELLKDTDVSFVQLSIDGNEEMHDSLRAPGDYTRVFKTAEMLEKAGIRTYISFTANKANYKFLPKVANVCRQKRITKLWSDRLVPIGNGEDLEQLKITAAEMPQYIRTLKKAQGSFITRLLFPKTQVTMNRALQFINSNGNVYSCSAGKSLITVDEFGCIMPCRRMPIVCGDIFTSTLEEVYYNDPTFIDLRRSSTAKECISCKYHYFCKGGAKCQSYALYGTYKKADPACFLKQNRN